MCCQQFWGLSSVSQPIPDHPKDEIHQRLKFTRRGLLGMANSGKNDNGSQFFITLDRADELDKKHTLFGKVRTADAREELEGTPMFTSHLALEYATGCWRHHLQRAENGRGPSG